MKDLGIINKLIFKQVSTYIQIFIFTIIFIILFYLFNATLIFFNYLNNFTTKSLDNRTLIVSLYEEDNMEDIAKIDHVNQIINFEYSHVLISSKEYESIELLAINDIELDNLKIIDGIKSLDNHNIICPKEFIPIDTGYLENTGINNKILDSKKLINKPFNIKYNTQTESEITINISANYNSYDYMLENNTCFASAETVFDITNLQNIEQDAEIYSSTYSVIVDNIKNMEYVKKELEKLGYSNYNNKVTMDEKLIDILTSISIVILIAILLVFGKIVSFNLKRDLNNNEKEILLYKSIGYSNKHIKLMYLQKFFYIFSISIIVSFTISIISFIILTHYLNNYMELRLLNFYIHPTSIILIIIIGIVYSEFIALINISRILNTKKINI